MSEVRDFFDTFHEGKQPKIEEEATIVEEEKKDDTTVVEEEKKDEPVVDTGDTEKPAEVKPEEEESAGKLSDEEALQLKETKLTEIEGKDEKDRTEDEKEFYTTYKETEDEPDTYVDIIKSLADESVLVVDEEKEYKGEEGFKELITDNIKSGIETYKNQFDPETAKYLKFLEDGGKRSDYWENLHEEKYAEVDATLPTNQKFLVEDLYKMQGYSADDIREKVEMLEEGGKLEKEAGIAKVHLTKYQTDRDQKIADDQTAAADVTRKQQAEYLDNFQKKVMEMQDVQGFKITKKEKEELIVYMSKPVKEGKTQNQIDGNLDNQITKAFLQKKKFDLSKLERKVGASAASDLRKSLDKLGGSKKFKNVKTPAPTSTPKEGEKLNIPWAMS